MAYTRNEIKELEPMVKSGKKRFVRYQESEELYSVGLHTFEQIAKEAGVQDSPLGIGESGHLR